MCLRRTTLLIACIIGGALGQRAHADDAITSLNNSFELSLQRTRLNYGETDERGYADSERGNPLGFRVGLTGLNARNQGNVFVQITYAHTSGDVGYTGHLLNSARTPVTGTSGAQLDDWQAKLGAAVLRTQNTALIPYAALGAHRWLRTVGKGTSGQYDETYTHQSLSAGLLTQITLRPQWLIAVNLAAGTTLNPHIDVPDVDLSEDLGTSSLFNAGVDLHYRLNPQASVFLGFDYVRYRYGISNVNYLGYYEPDSKTELISYNLGLRLAY